MTSHSGIHINWKGALLAVVLVLIVLGILFVFNASIPGRNVEGCPKGCATATTRRAGPLRVVDLNMLHGFPDFRSVPLRLELIAAELRRLDADVVLLEEVPWTRATGNGSEYLARQLGYNYVYYRAEGNHALIFFETGQAILSRFPLKNVASDILQPRAGFFESRVALAATADTPLGEVIFFVAHLTDKKSNPLINRGQAESLKLFVDAHANLLAVVGGDFNARENTPQIMELAGAWVDTYRSLHPDEAGMTCCIDNLTSGPGEALEERIDYIFLVTNSNQAGQLASARLVFDQPHQVGGGWQWVSDHIGLLVEIGQ